MTKSKLALMRHPLGFIASGAGAGLSPIAPGTAGTVTALLVWLLIRPYGLAALLVAVVLSFVLGIYAANFVIRSLAVEDPGFVVIDEWNGTFITLIPVHTLWLWQGYAPPLWFELLAAFLAFRLTDVLKPWPASWVDREVHGGFGAMADDSIAGVYAALILAALPWLPWFGSTN